MITYGEGKARLLSVDTMKKVFDGTAPMTMVRGLLFLEKKDHELIFPCFMVELEEDHITLNQIGINNVTGMEVYQTDMPMATFKKEWRLWSLPPKDEIRQKCTWLEQA